MCCWGVLVVEGVERMVLFPRDCQRSMDRLLLAGNWLAKPIVMVTCTLFSLYYFKTWTQFKTSVNWRYPCNFVLSYRRQVAVTCRRAFFKRTIFRQMATFKRIRAMLNEYERISYVKNILTRFNFTLNCNKGSRKSRKALAKILLLKYDIGIVVWDLVSKMRGDTKWD